ncbi:MAG: hypothetical protein M1814_001871 [Vezdaea aestivalis]|nr:MAG: hypothetical protein M1814_001871 [Vezdaea aestivalis]
MEGNNLRILDISTYNHCTRQYVRKLGESPLSSIAKLDMITIFSGTTSFPAAFNASLGQVGSDRIEIPLVVKFDFSLASQLGGGIYFLRGSGPYTNATVGQCRFQIESQPFQLTAPSGQGITVPSASSANQGNDCMYTYLKEDWPCSFKVTGRCDDYEQLNWTWELFCVSEDAPIFLASTDMSLELYFFMGATSIFLSDETY